MDDIKTPITTVRLPTSKPLVFERTKAGPPKRLAVLVYGPPGAGKTYFAGTFPNPFFLDCQGGLMTVRAKEVAFAQPESYQDLLQYAGGLGDSEFETVVLDTATEAARIVMDTALKAASREIPQMQDWMQTIERMRQLLRKLLDHDKHVIVACEEGVVKDEDTGKVIAGPSLPGKLFHEAGALFDCVFHLRSAFRDGKKDRVLLTQPEGLYQQVKDRTGKLEKLETPDFQVIWKKLQSA
jgi:hypothetical protein